MSEAAEPHPIDSLSAAEAIEAVHRLANAIVSYAMACLENLEAREAGETETPTEARLAFQGKTACAWLLYRTLHSFPNKPTIEPGQSVSLLIGCNGSGVDCVPSQPPQLDAATLGGDMVRCYLGGFPPRVELLFAKTNQTIASYGDIHATCWHRIPHGWLMWILGDDEQLARALGPDGGFRPGHKLSDLRELLAHLRREYLFAIDAAGGVPTEDAPQMPLPRKPNKARLERDDWVRSPEACALPHKQVLKRVNETPGWPPLETPGAISMIRKRG